MSDDPLHSDEEPFKIGAHRRGDGIVEFNFQNTYERHASEDAERLLIGPESGHVDLILRLMREMTPPLSVMYVLLAPHTDARPGRYQTTGLDTEDVKNLLTRFREFFEGDARHHLWIGSISARELLVYDQHDVIYAYGPIDQFEAIVQSIGFKEGPVSLPYPHTHHFRGSLDEFERELLNSYEWSWAPLEEEDEQD